MLIFLTFIKFLSIFEQMFIRMAQEINKRANSREKIVQTALELFSSQGFEKTSIREIARSADISLGLLYNYFESKESLLRAIVMDGIRDVHQFFEFNPEEHNKLEALISKIFINVKKKKKHWRLLHNIRMQKHLTELLAEELEEVNNYIIAELSLILQELRYQQPMQEAVLLFATIDGITNHYLTNNRYPIEKIMRLLFAKYQKL